MIRRRLRGDRERGASSVELVAFTPLLMLAILVIVQLALTWYGNELAGAVAREAARVVRTGGGTPESVQDAQVRAVEFAEQIGGTSLTDLAVVVERPDDLTVRVTVTGRAVEIVQGMAPGVSATVHGPVERFRADQ